jgi:glucan phosphoethanolaminetransferase (alkaline phosphatase superfamily)
MENELYQIILEGPIFLTLVIIFILIIIYSVLKKFFKLLIITFLAILIYISYLIYSGDDLPGESEKFINPLIEKSSLILNIVSDEFKSFFEKNNKD